MILWGKLSPPFPPDYLIMAGMDRQSGQLAGQDVNLETGAVHPQCKLCEAAQVPLRIGCCFSLNVSLTIFRHF